MPRSPEAPCGTLLVPPRAAYVLLVGVPRYPTAGSAKYGSGLVSQRAEENRQMAAGALAQLDLFFRELGTTFCICDTAAIASINPIQIVRDVMRLRGGGDIRPAHLQCSG